MAYGDIQRGSDSSDGSQGCQQDGDGAGKGGKQVDGYGGREDGEGEDDGKGRGVGIEGWCM